MLDMSVRAKILELMIDLKRELDLTYLYITHDLATAKFFCDRIAIMYLGKIVEIGPSAAIYEDPRHPYTVSLLRAIPEPDPTRACRATCLAARYRTRRGRRSAARSIPAARTRSRSAAGRAGTCAPCSRTAGPGLGEEEYDAERKVIGDLDSLDDPAHGRATRGGGRPRRRAGHGRDRANARRGAGRSLLGAACRRCGPSRARSWCASTTASSPATSRWGIRASSATSTTTRRSRGRSRPRPAEPRTRSSDRIGEKVAPRATSRHSPGMNLPRSPGVGC